MIIEFIIPSVRVGGAERITADIALEFAARGAFTSVLIPFSNNNFPLRRLLQTGGVIVKQGQWLTAKQSATRITRGQEFLRMKLHKLTHPRRLSVLILPWPTTSLGCHMALATGSDPAFVVFQLIGEFCNWSSTAERVFERRLGRKFKWIAVSKQNESLLRSSLSCQVSGITTCYNGIRPLVQIGNELRETLRARIRTELGWEKDTTVCITTGHICPQKGYHIMIPAIQHVIRSFPRTRFLWIGGGSSYRNELEKQISQRGLNGYIAFAGLRENVSDYLWAGDLFICPSLFEGFSLSLLEGMSAGLPVLASSASSFPEVIHHNQEGWLFRIGDPCDLLELLRDILDMRHTWAAVGSAARSRSLQFNLNKTVNSYWDICQELLNP